MFRRLLNDDNTIRSPEVDGTGVVTRSRLPIVEEIR